MEGSHQYIFFSNLLFPSSVVIKYILVIWKFLSCFSHILPLLQNSGIFHTYICKLSMKKIWISYFVDSALVNMGKEKNTWSIFFHLFPSKYCKNGIPNYVGQTVACLLKICLLPGFNDCVIEGENIRLYLVLKLW